MIKSLRKKFNRSGENVPLTGIATNLDFQSKGATRHNTVNTGNK